MLHSFSAQSWITNTSDHGRARHVKTVFASASRSAADHPLTGASAHAEASHELAHAVGSSLTGSAVLLSLALAVAVLVMRRPPTAAPAPLAQSRVLGRL